MNVKEGELSVGDLAFDEIIVMAQKFLGMVYPMNLHFNTIYQHLSKKS